MRKKTAAVKDQLLIKFSKNGDLITITNQRQKGKSLGVSIMKKKDRQSISLGINPLISKVQKMAKKKPANKRSKMLSMLKKFDHKLLKILEDNQEKLNPSEREYLEISEQISSMKPKFLDGRKNKQSYSNEIKSHAPRGTILTTNDYLIVSDPNKVKVHSRRPSVETYKQVAVEKLKIYKKSKLDRTIQSNQENSSCVKTCCRCSKLFDKNVKALYYTKSSKPTSSAKKSNQRYSQNTEDHTIRLRKGSSNSRTTENPSRKRVSNKDSYGLDPRVFQDASFSSVTQQYHPVLLRNPSFDANIGERLSENTCFKTQDPRAYLSEAALTESRPKSIFKTGPPLVLQERRERVNRVNRLSSNEHSFSKKIQNDEHKENRAVQRECSSKLDHLKNDITVMMEKFTQYHDYLNKNLR